MNRITFKWISYSEAISFLVLLGIAMPLKYLMDMPLAVRIVGSLHGFLFIAYIAAAYVLANKERWKPKMFALAFAAAVLPFGPFVFEKKLEKV